MTPLNVRRFYAPILGALLVLAGFTQISDAQTVAQAPSSSPISQPTSGDVMRDRISKSKAFIAVRNYNAAIYELENIKRESADPTVRGVVNVLLMNSYLDQADYKRAQELLLETYNLQKTTTPHAAENYRAVAGQIIKGARSRVERYRALGLTVSDRTLPLEALNDLEKMRETLELVITQSKEIGTDKTKGAEAMAMIEEAGNSRTMLARDDYDSRLWMNEVADTREKMATSQSVVTSSVTPFNEASIVAVAVKTEEPTVPVMQPVIETKTVPTPITREREVKVPDNAPSDSTVAKVEKPIAQPLVSVPKDETKTPPKVEIPVAETPKKQPEAPVEQNEQVQTEGPKESLNDDSPLEVGSLIGYATSQAKPVYPAAAKVIRATGIVTVEVMINESGEVANVQKTSGPSMLQAAAKDAIRKWRFKPFMRDGVPVRATGFVSFNFAL